MLVTLFGIVTAVSLEQPENAYHPMVVTPLPILMLLRLVQSEKAEAPIVVTLSGIVTAVSLEQPENAYHPMVVTPLPILMLLRLMQSEKAEAPMVVTLPGIVTAVSLEQPEKGRVPDAGDAIRDHHAGEVAAARE